MPQPPHLDIAELVRRSQAMAKAAVATATAAQAGAEDVGATSHRLREVATFGRNPGALRMRVFVPDALPPDAPLLVVLHGCTQTAAGFDQGCGWSDLAERLGFALLLPEQRQANNPNRCFNWFEPGDTARGQGEAASIRAMVAHMLTTYRLDPARVFVTGLSAGGAMASVLLATYPEVFAAGAIIGGLPYGAASNVQEAFETMASGRTRSAAAWAEQVRAAAPDHRGPWPRIAIWQGEADTTVRPVNAAELVKQWTALHGVNGGPSRMESGGNGGGPLRRTWRDASGRVVVELNLLPGLAHGVPIHPGEGPERGGRPMPFILDAGISAPHRIAGFFGLDRPASTATAPEAAAARPMNADAFATPGLRGVITVGRDAQARLPGAGDRDGAARPDQASPPQDEDDHHRRGAAAPPPKAGRGIDPGAIIRRALTAAGLMKRP